MADEHSPAEVIDLTADSPSPGLEEEYVPGPSSVVARSSSPGYLTIEDDDDQVSLYDYAKYYYSPMLNSLTVQRITQGHL